MSQWCASQTTTEALNAMEAAKVPAGPVYSPQQVLDDPHIQQLGLFEEIDYPSACEPVLVAGVPVKLSATPGKIRQRAPMLAEHTNEILSELGYEDMQIAALKKRQIV